MSIMRDAVAIRRQGIGPLQRLMRLALVAYLSPVILVVLAIGLIGMLAAKIGKPAARVAVEGVHTTHRLARPMGLVRTPSKVVETANLDRAKR